MLCHVLEKLILSTTITTHSCAYRLPATVPWLRVRECKTSALAIAVGDRVFWDATNKVVNKTTTSQQCVGIAVEAAANPSSTVAIKLGCYTAVAA